MPLNYRALCAHRQPMDTHPNCTRERATQDLFCGIPTVSKSCLGSRAMQLQRSASQIWSLRAATAKAFTTVLAGFAFTFTSLPKIFLTPALVAGFTRVLILQRPGIVKMPFFFTSPVASSAKLSRRPDIALVLSSCLSAKALTIAPFDMALAPAFIAFIDFIFFMAMILEQAKV